AMATSVLAGEGQGGGKGIGIRLISGAGATHPMVGVKTTFNATGAPVSIGPATSIVFDVMSTSGSSLWVELEQSDIADGAYYQKEIDFANSSWNRIRIPISALAQPSWK